MNQKRLQELRDVYRSGLLDDVIPFWIRHGIDREHGGYFSALDRDGSLLDSDESVWVQGRFAWMLATLYNTVEKNPDWLELAKHGLDFLDQYGSDPSDGLMWFQLTSDGRPLRKRRYRFSESFACLANATYFQATGEQARAERKPLERALPSSPNAVEVLAALRRSNIDKTVLIHVGPVKTIL